ncbi:baseplate multidomain protein megatron [Agrobacterium vitis]|uniref:baseplate multidomain protein megatron n=1 Tax=Agrobacterium vitis TaxID=373 RepID=UPI001F1E403D|nr:glycoside hydrolase/phage tail family protein [Agrobacterium vitis]
MATLVFQAAGAAIGSIFGPVGTMLGRAVGSLAGNMVDQALINGSSTTTGWHLSSARIGGASEGTALNRAYGTVRIGGTLIWATRFEEKTTTETSGSKSTGSKTKSYDYYGNLALALCEGPVAAIRRVWADGEEVDLTEVEMRFYPGSEDQGVDPLIAAKQGEGNAPAYRGVAYVVFERLPLDDYGNRLPVLQFEVIRPLGALESQVRAVTIIPGATEHGYATKAITEETGDGEERIINRNTLVAATDWQASLDELQAVCPNLVRAALVVSWFGTDLRADQCDVVPGVEVARRDEESRAWSVAGIGRASARLVSQNGGGPAYGGTPSDKSVIEAIKDLNSRGIATCLYPFVMMDIPSGNGLADPYGGTEQAAYPWRGRITCSPAPGLAGSPDGTDAMDAIVEAFIGKTTVDDFFVLGTTILYTGNKNGCDSGYRRLVLHSALLAKAAGGVDSFVIGSELKGLTTLRGADNSFPFVAALMRLAEDVRAILGSQTKLTYGADWSEYFGYHPGDGSGNVFFHLDPLWASAAIDAVGIDNYMPLSDWNDADFTADNPDGFTIADDRAAMQAQIAAGEGYDWYYPDLAARKRRERAAITDGLAGKPWVYRYKDIQSWWENHHYNRVGGVELSTPSAWVPKQKPIWFTELGCPAVERGANQPNVFPDPKSSENALPYFSSGMRSDAMQRRFLEAHLGYWQEEAAPAGMVDADHIFLWTWDSRPFPAFPYDTDLFADGDNWRSGHWLNGRLGGGTLAEVIAAILEDCGFSDYDVSAVTGDLSGYVQGDVSSARSLIEPLTEAFLIDVIEDGTVLRFRSRQAASLKAVETRVFVDTEDEPFWTETRGDSTDYAGQAVLDFYDPANDYEDASVRSRRVVGTSAKLLSSDLPAVLDEASALAVVETQLRDHRIGRRSLTLSLSPSQLALQPGDVLTLPEGPSGRFLITRIEDSSTLSLELTEVAAPVSSAITVASSGRVQSGRASDGFAPLWRLMDLPRLDDGADGSFARAAAYASPWRKIVLSSSAETENYATRVVVDGPATLGSLSSALAAGVSGRFDRANRLTVTLSHGSFSSGSRLSVLNGDNRLAIKAANDVWEVIGFQTAEEVESGVWQLSGLLRGLYGTEDAMVAGAVAGAQVVLLNSAVTALDLADSEIDLTLNWIAEAAGTSLAAKGPVSFSGRLRALTPLSPVHLRASRAPSGDIALTWVRRGRTDADNWTPSDIALDEESERYQLDILDAGQATLRSVTLTSAGYAYSADLQAADFGATPSTLAIRVRQIGRHASGIAAEAAFTF